MIRREITQLLEPDGTEKKHFNVVGFVHINDNGKSYVHSYVGDENGTRILGFKEVKDFVKLNPTEFASEFGWKSS